MLFIYLMFRTKYANFMKKKTEEKMLKQPYYEGGVQAMKELVQKNLQYPTVMIGSGIEGTVSIRYDIDHHGDVVGCKIISGIGTPFEEEAERVIRLFKFVVPKTPRKLKVLFHKTIHIHFKVPPAVTNSKTEEQTQTPQTIHYTYITSSVPTTQEPTSAKTFQYQINITKS